MLGTTEGAIKAELHRGRSKIKDIDASHAGPAPDLAVLDRVVERCNARDLPGLLELMLDHATIEREIAAGTVALSL